MSIFKIDLEEFGKMAEEVFARGFFNLPLKELKCSSNIADDRELIEFMSRDMLKYTNFINQRMGNKLSMQYDTPKEYVYILDEYFNECRKIRQVYFNNLGHWPEEDFPSQDIRELGINLEEIILE